MSRKKGYDWYRLALVGLPEKQHGDYKGLRSYASGFEPNDGFDLHNFEAWTPSQKAKVTRYYETVAELQTRANVEFRSSNKKNLKIVQRVAHSVIERPLHVPNLKVAFVPYTPSMDVTGRVIKQRPKISVTRRGEMVVEDFFRQRRFVPFDLLGLATDPEAEVARAMRNVPPAKIYTIQAGLHEITGGAIGMAGDIETATKQVIKLQQKYNGETMPRKSKNKNDMPDKHHWSLWLRGLNAYQFKNQQRPEDLGNDIVAAGRRQSKAGRAKRAKMRQAGSLNKKRFFK